MARSCQRADAMAQEIRLRGRWLAAASPEEAAAPAASPLRFATPMEPLSPRQHAQMVDLRAGRLMARSGTGSQEQSALAAALLSTPDPDGALRLHDRLFGLARGLGGVSAPGKAVRVVLRQVAPPAGADDAVQALRQVALLGFCMGLFRPLEGGPNGLLEALARAIARDAPECHRPAMARTAGHALARCGLLQLPAPTRQGLLVGWAAGSDSGDLDAALACGLLSAVGARALGMSSLIALGDTCATLVAGAPLLDSSDCAKAIAKALGESRLAARDRKALMQAIGLPGAALPGAKHGQHGEVAGGEGCEDAGQGEGGRNT